MSVAYDLEYLQATGTQYINTGYVPNQNTRIVLDAHIVPTTTNDPVFGARTATTNNVFALWTSSTAVNPQYGNVAYNTQTISMDCNQRLIYELNKNVFTVNGTTKTFAEATFDSTYPMYLFQINNGGSIFSRYTKGKIYSCKIYDNDVLVRDFVPKLIDGVAGLYDNVSGDFYTNAGTGNFGYTLTTLCEDCGFNNFFAARRRMLIDGGGKAEPLYIYLSGWSAIQNADYGRKNSSIWTEAGLAYADDNEYAQITENLVYFKVNMSLLKKDHKKLVIDACMSSVFGYEGYLSWGTGSSPSEPVGYKATIPNSTTRNIYEFDISDKNMSDGYFYIYFKKNSTLQSINIYDVHFE